MALEGVAGRLVDSDSSGPGDIPAPSAQRALQSEIIEVLDCSPPSQAHSQIRSPHFPTYPEPPLSESGQNLEISENFRYKWSYLLI